MMKLFNAIEKCFPEMERQFRTYHPRWHDGCWSTMISPAHFSLRRWVMETMLSEDGELYGLFKQAGQLEKDEMASLMTDWFIYYLNLREA